MFQVDVRNRKSIYEQVMDNIKELIITGVLPPAGKLPSVRELSGILTVNPNTVQKAYRELEREGYVYSVSGQGTFVEKPELRRVDEDYRRAAADKARQAVRDLCFSGIAKGEILKMTETWLSDIEPNGTAPTSNGSTPTAANATNSTAPTANDEASGTSGTIGTSRTKGVDEND
jgi:GntR family transcriptional regulator